MRKHLAEITKELFYANVEAESEPVAEIESGSTYTDAVFTIHGTVFIRRTQSAATNYYIQDINA